ncbi:penicillin-binding protein [Treponema sp.]|uniref:penicillin-binding protein n=1 Tax=Treponema sp. TaxID=166 RepID=UPI0025EEB2E3|nr:penicillin-binding protein [Treponema sp.]MCR5218258.1 transpeptidase family protein [Treponema sp.]
MQVNGFFQKKRFITVLTVFVLFTGYTIWNFIQLSFVKKQPADEITKTQDYERGSIVDRNGKSLAVQTTFYTLAVTAKNVPSPEEFVKDIAKIIDIDQLQTVEKIKNSIKSPSTPLKKKITQDEYKALLKLFDEKNYRSFWRLDKVPGRIYPENSLASQLIGYMGIEGSGLSGIELSQDKLLSPDRDKSKEAEKDSGQEEKSDDNLRSTQNVYLTIDSSLQYKLEQIAGNAMKEHQAESVILIASYAKTGEILSYITLPSANLNDYTSYPAECRIDRPAVTVYEPGSVFKIFSVAAFLDNGSITPDDSFKCDGVYSRKTSGGEVIRIKCLDHHGYLTAKGALKYSCNDALAQMSETINTDTFLEYLHNFGFGEKTGVELPSETKGIIKDQNDKLWSARSKPTISIGQEISVSALQMVQAATVIANRGVKVPLTFIHRITDAEGTTTYSHQTSKGQRVISESTAKYILECMETTARSGTGTKASLKDISIGVKTGTAQMTDPSTGRYSTTDFISNCMAVFPVENPEIVLYIVIEKPKGETYAGRIVAPVIAQAADEIIDYLGMNRDQAPSFEHSGYVTIEGSSPIQVESTVPDFTGRPKRDLLSLLKSGTIKFEIHGEGWVVKQNPPAGSPVTKDMTIELYLEH